MKTTNNTSPPTSPMGESKYLQTAHAGRNKIPQQPQDLTPCLFSAVSSFNLPTYCDSSLITPVTTRSSNMVGKNEPALRTDRDIKLSPATVSPTFHFISTEEDYSSGRYVHNPPMKHKSPSGTIHMSTWDNSFPESPLICPDPFYGSYSVSATTVSGRSDSSQNLNPSPTHLNSTGCLSNSSSPLNGQPTATQSASSYRARNQAPILIAPNPSTLRPATKQEGPYRQNSFRSTSMAPSSVTLAQGPFSEPLGSLRPRGKKRKSPCRDTRKLNRDKLILREDKTPEEDILLGLTLNKSFRWKWKDVADRFEEATGKRLSEATLQMREKRAIARLRVWTEEDEHALSLAVKEFNKNKWETISDKMMKYGCVAHWPKEACERKWYEMHPEDQYLSHFEAPLQNRGSEDGGLDEGSYSDGRASVCHSLQEIDSGVQMSEISAPTIDEVRSRAASDASSQMFHMRNQHRQQRMIFDEQQQQNGWGVDN